MSVNIDNLQRGNLHQRGVQHKWPGFYRAIVIDSEDPKLLGRAKIRVPDVMPEKGDDYTGEWELNGIWAHPANNYLGGRNVQDMVEPRASFIEGQYQGSCLIPPVGSWVWVFFENGELNHPYYFGSLEAGQQKVLPENQLGTEYWKKWTLIKTNSGRCVIVSDDADDERVEITGKKRMINTPPNGDLDSVYTIDDNQTVILLHEVAGEEKLLIKDYHGNFINIHTETPICSDQLHIFFKDDIHIETQKNLFIKTGEEMHVDVGSNFFLTASENIDVKAGLTYKEKALNFHRFTLITDKRTALISMNDTAGIKLEHCAGLEMSHGTLLDHKITGMTVDVRAYLDLNLEGSATINEKSGGSISINGSATNIQCGAEGAPDTFPYEIASYADSASPAQPDGDRRQDLVINDIPEPVVPNGDMDPPPAIIVPPVVGDPYDQTFDSEPAWVPDSDEEFL